MVNFSGTYDVQDVSVFVNKWLVCVTCHMAHWTTTHECSVIMFSSESHTIRSVHINNTQQFISHQITNCIQDITPGQYHILAFDVNVKSKPAVSKFQYLDVQIQPTEICKFMIS